LQIGITNKGGINLSKDVFKSKEGKLQILSYYDNILKKWPVPYEHININTRYGNTFIIASGDVSKEPVVMLHGSSTNSAMWMGDVLKLSKEFRVYAVDIIGEPGKSYESRPELQPLNYADWILDIFNELKINKANFVGNSLGGWMSLCFATQYPERVNKLVLIAASGIVPAKKSFLVKVICLSLLGSKGIDKINGIVYGNLKVPDEVLRFGNLVYNNFNPRMGELYVFNDNELKSLSMPVLYIAGEKDALLQSGKTSERLMRILDKVEVNIIKDQGHVVIGCADEIVRFLNKEWHS